MCAHVSHSATKVVNIFKGLDNVEDLCSGSRCNEAVRSPFAFSPALLLGPNISTSLVEHEVLQSSDPSVPL